LSKNKLVFIISFVLIFSVAISAGAATLVETVKPEIGDIRNFKKVTGSVEALKTINLPAELNGIVKQVNVEIGDEVEQGDELLVFNKDQLLIQIKLAEASLEMSRANYEQVKNGATVEELQRAEASYQQAVRSYEGAKENLQLMEELFNNKIALKQQLSGAASQLASAEKQLQKAEEGYKQAKNNFDQSQREYERMQYLYQEEVVTEKQFELAKSQYQNAKSGLNTAEISREQAKIAYQTAQNNYELTESTFNNPTQLKQQLASAQNQVRVAESSMHVAKAALEQTKKGARKEQIQASLAQVKQAEASLEQAKLRLEDATIKSPLSGIIAAVNIDEGEMIGAGQPVITVIEINEVYVAVDVTADIMVKLNKGDSVKVNIENMPGDLTGKVSNISPVTDPRSKAYPVKIRLANKENNIKPGMFAEVSFIKEFAENTLLIPITAVESLDQNPYVYLVENDKAVKKDVELGIRNDQYIEILTGVQAGDTVVSRGQSQLNTGDEVEVK